MPGVDGQLGRRRDVPRLHFVLPAIVASVPIARHRLRAWLADLDWPVDDAEDLEFVLNEAVANVIDHAYPPPTSAPIPPSTEPEAGDNRTDQQATADTAAADTAASSTADEAIVEVVAHLRWLTDGKCQIQIEVCDRGRWRPPPADPGYRGRGLMAMAAMTDQMTVARGHPDQPGTTVTLLSPAVNH
jgi:serine/threonine-protein kinase RsbW